jgi:hypothetical protein
MTFVRRLLQIEAVSLATLFVFIALVAVLFSCLAVMDGQSLAGVGEILWISVLSGAVIGTPLVALYGAPIYALLSSRTPIRWPVAVLIGAIPGLLLAFWMGSAGLTWAGLGALVAVSTHIYLSRGPQIDRQAS